MIENRKKVMEKSWKIVCKVCVNSVFNWQKHLKAYTRDLSQRFLLMLIIKFSS